MKKNRKQDTKQDEIEIEPMGSKLSNLPIWVLITFVKYWAAAAAVFFIIIGGSDVGVSFTADNTNAAVVLTESVTIIVLIALFSALFMNYATKFFTRMMYSRRNDSYRFVIYAGKGLSSFFIYLAYSLLMSLILFFVVVWFGTMGWVLDPFGTTGGLGIEPFSYAFYYIVIDAIFLLLKNLILNIHYRRSYSKGMNDNSPIIVEA